MLRSVHAADTPVDDGLLEFLGSVDSDDKNWREYLAASGTDPAAKRAGTAPANPGAPGPRRCSAPERAPGAWQPATPRRPRPLTAMSGATHWWRACCWRRVPALRATAGRTRRPAAPVQPAQPLAWSSLPPAQQQLLGHFQGQWDSLPPLRQQALSRGAERWLSMTPEQRSSARERFQTWQKLPPEQRALIRQRWQRFQSLPPEQQRAVRQNFRFFSRLPPQQRAQLRERWVHSTPQQRQQMLQMQRPAATAARPLD